MQICLYLPLSKEVSGGSFRSYGSNYGWVLLGCVLQGLLNWKSWVTVRAAGAKKSNRGMTFSGRRSIVGGCVVRAVAGCCGPVRAGAGCSPVVCCFLLLGVRVSPAAGCMALCHADCWRACRVGGAVPCGLLVCVLRGWRCAMGIAGVRVGWVALCHGDCWWACRVGGAVPCGLLVCVSRGWRCAMGIAGGRVVWVALCHADCWCACRVGGAVPWGLLACVSRGWRCAMGIAGGRVAWVAPCLGDC